MKKKKVVKRNSYHPTVESMATITTNNDIQKKSILISRTSDKSPKLSTRNVRFAPEITLNNEQITMANANSSTIENKNSTKT